MGIMRLADIPRLFLQEQGYEKIYLPPTDTGYYWHYDAFNRDDVDTGLRKLVHILHGDVMIHIIGKGGRQVFDQFNIQLYERHGIKAIHLGIFCVNGQQMEDFVSTPWEPHRARYGLRYASGCNIPNTQTSVLLKEGGSTKGPSAQGGGI